MLIRNIRVDAKPEKGTLAARKKGILAHVPPPTNPQYCSRQARPAIQILPTESFPEIPKETRVAEESLTQF